jgi:hypothetical protein
VASSRAGRCLAVGQGMISATLTSVALEDPGARVDAPGVGHDQRSVLTLQKRSSDVTRPDDEVPQTIELPNDDVHLSVFLEDLRASK